jgi:UPF0716 protein FxsA
VRLLLIAFIAWPLVEIALFIAIGQTIGLWPTLLGVIAMGIVGGLILRHSGLARLAEARRSLASGQLPARAIADAMLISGAGVLIAIPGYLSGVLGLLLLIPPLRQLLYLLLGRRFRVVGAAGPAPAPSQKRTIELDSDEFRPR